MFKPSFKQLGVVASIIVLASSALAGTITVPNYSFEGPAVSPTNTFFAQADLDSWQKTPQPVGFDPNTQGNWYAYSGEFLNSPYSGALIDNVDASQGCFLFTYPGSGIFQDYDSIGGTNSSVPTHAFNATFTAGKYYKLTTGFTVSFYQPPPQGASIAMQLYYRDALGKIVVVASTNIINSTNVFNPVLHLYDFSVQTPVVTASNAWAGKKIGIQFIYSSDLAHAGGYFDFDNVRLVETIATQLTNPLRTNGQFTFNIVSEPGLGFQVLTSTNITSAYSNWTVLGTVSNITGTLPIAHVVNTNSPRRFYSVKQL
jgi:hypothetical protein